MQDISIQTGFKIMCRADQAKLPSVLLVCCSPAFESESKFKNRMNVYNWKWKDFCCETETVSYISRAGHGICGMQKALFFVTLQHWFHCEMCLVVVSCVALFFQIGNVSSWAFAVLHLCPHKAVISVQVIRCKLWSKCFLWGCCPTFSLCHMNPSDNKRNNS